MNHKVGAKAPPLPHATVDKEPGDINPEVVGEFLGCDVVMDDQVLQDVENNDDLEAFDSIGVTLPVAEQVAPAAPAEYTAHTVDTDAPAAPVEPVMQTEQFEQRETSAPTMHFGSLELIVELHEGTHDEPDEPLVTSSALQSSSVTKK